MERIFDVERFILQTLFSDTWCSVSWTYFVLRVEMKQRFAQQPQPVNPHFGRREGVAPGNQTRAVGIRAGPLAEGGGLLRAFDYRLKQDGGGDAGRAVQGVGDLPGVGRDLLQRLGAIKALASGDEPELTLFKVYHAGQWNGCYAGTADK